MPAPILATRYHLRSCYGGNQKRYSSYDLMTDDGETVCEDIGTSPAVYMIRDDLNAGQYSSALELARTTHIGALVRAIQEIVADAKFLAAAERDAEAATTQADMIQNALFGRRA